MTCCEPGIYETSRPELSVPVPAGCWGMAAPHSSPDYIVRVVTPNFHSGLIHDLQLFPPNVLEKTPLVLLQFEKCVCVSVCMGVNSSVCACVFLSSCCNLVFLSVASATLGYGRRMLKLDSVCQCG